MNNRIKELREQQGISQNILAKKAGLSVGYICHLEKGTRQNPSYRTLEKIATALNKRVDEVFNIGHSNEVMWNLKEEKISNKLSIARSKKSKN